MSAIVALARFEGPPVTDADVRLMADAIAYRAPDGIGVASYGSVGLGHGALHTSAEARAESLPLQRTGRQLAITADLRLDNREELIRKLGLGDAGRSIGDGELILAAYEEWGEVCPEHLRGDFAFVIWDGSRQALFCARDHFGVKPLYWHARDGLVAIGSELAALVAVPEVPRRLNEQTVLDYLAGHHDTTATLYRDLWRLEPAHALTIERGRAPRKRRFWALDPDRQLELGSDEAYAEAYREAFLDAVRVRCRGTGPIGAMLSGGMDSSSVVGAARHLLVNGAAARPLPTFSAVFDLAPKSDERGYIEAVIAQGGIEPHYERPERWSPLGAGDGAAWRGAQPLLNPQIATAWATYEPAGAAGVRVMLDGHGGDNTISYGYGRLGELAQARQWRSWWHEARALSRRSDRTLRQLARTHIVRPALPSSLLHLRGLLLDRRAGGPSWSLGAPISQTLAVRLDLAARYRGHPGSVPPSERVGHLAGLEMGLNSYSLELADRAAARFGVEPRYPFFDSRLAELCLSLPADQKLRNGYPRWIPRAALGDLLPDVIRWRTDKGNLGYEFHRSLFTTDRELLESVILDDPKAIEEFVDTDSLRGIYRRALETRQPGPCFTVWRVATLALWLGQAPQSCGLRRS